MGYKVSLRGLTPDNIDLCSWGTERNRLGLMPPRRDHWNSSSISSAQILLLQTQDQTRSFLTLCSHCKLLGISYSGRESQDWLKRGPKYFCTKNVTPFLSFSLLFIGTSSWHPWKWTKIDFNCLSHRTAWLRPGSRTSRRHVSVEVHFWQRLCNHI